MDLLLIFSPLDMLSLLCLFVYPNMLHVQTVVTCGYFKVNNILLQYFHLATAKYNYSPLVVSSCFAPTCFLLTTFIRCRQICIVIKLIVRFVETVDPVSTCSNTFCYCYMIIIISYLRALCNVDQFVNLVSLLLTVAFKGKEWRYK